MIVHPNLTSTSACRLALEIDQTPEWRVVKVMRTRRYGGYWEVVTEHHGGIMTRFSSWGQWTKMRDAAIAKAQPGEEAPDGQR